MFILLLSSVFPHLLRFQKLSILSRVPCNLYIFQVHLLSTSFVPGLSFQKNVQQDSSEAGTQPQVQTDGQQTTQSPPSPELTSEENKTPDADKVSDASSSFPWTMLQHVIINNNKSVVSRASTKLSYLV